MRKKERSCIGFWLKNLDPEIKVNTCATLALKHPDDGTIIGHKSSNSRLPWTSLPENTINVVILVVLNWFHHYSQISIKPL